MTTSDKNQTYIHISKGSEHHRREQRLCVGREEVQPAWATTTTPGVAGGLGKVAVSGKWLHFGLRKREFGMLWLPSVFSWDSGGNEEKRALLHCSEAEEIP